MNEQPGKHRKPEDPAKIEEQLVAQRQTAFINRMLGIENPSLATTAEQQAAEDRGFHYYG